MKPKINQSQLLVFVILLALIPFLVFGIFQLKDLTFINPSISPLPSLDQKMTIRKFTSIEEFKNYLIESDDSINSFSGGVMRSFGSAKSVGLTTPSMKITDQAMESGRVSQTNVQVMGIDEPDIVKTDGKKIYYSGRNYYYPLMDTPVSSRGITLEESQKIAPIPPIQERTKTINAFPADNISLLSNIDKNGNLLLLNNMLVIFSYNGIYGYDISDAKNPKQKWNLEVKNGSYFVQARLYNNKIYTVFAKYIQRDNPCPIEPFSVNGKSLNIRCFDIYYPEINIPIDNNYTISIIDPFTGNTEKNISFVGSSNSTVVYMSKNNIYLTYSYYGDLVSFMYNFYTNEGRDLISQVALNKLHNLANYEISNRAKQIELSMIIENYKNSLSSDDRLRIENELANRMESYLKRHNRELQKTGIVKIGLGDFKISSTGEVPGAPLNQFSLDELNGNLRIATTIQNWINGTNDSVSDVYILSSDLKTLGTVRDLGRDERIYSVRFIGDKGYVVTFRQTDPFYVLDLSSSTNPRLEGQLKIPGFSSYLHPLAENKILGVGKEGAQVKLSLFDVSTASDPRERSKYTLDEYTSDVLETSTAFLQDAQHKVFFIPGGKGGYVFSYENDDLKLVKAVSDIQARRAVYINDYLYVLGDDKMIVLDENNWQQVNQLIF